MKLHQLRHFVAVASTGSLRAAARQLGLTQPSLTKSIRQLEKDLECSLFERHAHGAALSLAGRAFLPRAEVVLNELHRGATELKQLGGDAGAVTMAVSSAIALSVLPDVVSEFRRTYPLSPMRLMSSGFAVMFNELRAGSLDFSVGPRPGDPMGSEFSVERLFGNSQAVICRRGHPLCDARLLGDLVDAQWLVTGATGVPADEHDKIFLRFGLKVPSSTVQCESLTALIALLASTDMLTIVPRQFATSSILSDLLVQIPVQETFPQVDIVLIQRAGLPLTPTAAHMCTLLQRHIEYQFGSATDSPLA